MICCPFLQNSCVSFDSANTTAIAGKLKEFNGNLDEVRFVRIAKCSWITRPAIGVLSLLIRS